jgi:predicted aspartyl protease
VSRVWPVWMACLWVSGLVASGVERTREVPNLPMLIDEATGQVAVEVAVGDGAPHPWMVDTGSSRSAVNETLATGLNLSTVARTEVVTASGTDVRAVVRLPNVTVGGVTAGADLMVMVLPDDRLPGVQGLLGQDFLSRFHYTLDYRQGRFEWGRRGETTGERLRLRPSEGRFLVDLPRDGGDPVRMVPDSGATALVLFRKAGLVAVPLITTPGARLALRGVAGDRVADAVRLPGLKVGGRVLRDLPAAVLDVPEDEAWPDGLLPLHLFDRVTFNAPEGYLIVD